MKQLRILLILASIITAFVLGRYMDQLPIIFSPLPEGNIKSMDIPKEYFDFNVETAENATTYVRFSGLPSSDVADVGYSVDVVEYNEKELFTSMYGLPDVEDYDIDNDGTDETVLLTSVAMTHSPHQAIIVKDGKIIFQSEPLSELGFMESESKNGFYLYGTPANEIGTGYRMIRFAWVNDKLAPVWQQKVTYLNYR